MAKQREAYQTYVSALLKLAGITDPNKRAEQIMALETKVAKAHADRVTSEDVHKANNPWSITQLSSGAPGLDWNTYLSAANLDKQTIFIVWQPDAIKGLSALVESEPVETWKDWMIFHTLNQSASFLPKAYDELRFGFYGKTLQGTLKQRNRWKRALTNVNADLGCGRQDLCREILSAVIQG